MIQNRIQFYESINQITWNQLSFVLEGRVRAGQRSDHASVESLHGRLFPGGTQRRRTEDSIFHRLRVDRSAAGVNLLRSQFDYHQIKTRFSS